MPNPSINQEEARRSSCQLKISREDAPKKKKHGARR
jgi:hypothetical protein